MRMKEERKQEGRGKEEVGGGRREAARLLWLPCPGSPKLCIHTVLVTEADD